MAKANNRVLKMLSTALKMEEKGKTFYEKAAGKCKTEQGKDIFRMLMADEIMHKRRIENIYQSLSTGEPWSEKWKKLKVDPKKLDSFFQKMASKHGLDVKSETTDIKAMDIGIDLELKSIKFYEKNLNKATNILEREFLSRMIEEEGEHYDALSNMKSYLVDPVGWFREKERAGLEG